MKLKVGMREKIILFSAVCLGAVFLWYELLYLPKQKELESISKELKSIQTQRESLLKTGVLQPFFMVAEEEAAVSAQYNKLAAKIPDRNGLPSAMIQMMRRGQGRNIRVISMTPALSQLLENHTQADECQLREIPVDIVLGGKFVDVGRYLLDLMGLPFFGGYHNLQMETSEETYPEIDARIGCILLFFNNR
jgi:Tfp pilus assembly protein PilO